MHRIFSALLILSALGACTKKSPNPGLLVGKIDVSPALKDKIQPTDVMFIIARQGQGGPPLAVRKVASPVLPMDYALSPSDVMFQGAAFEGKVDITVRIDKDGDAMSKNPGDLFGKHDGAMIGDAGVNVTIDQAIQ